MYFKYIGVYLSYLSLSSLGEANLKTKMTFIIWTKNTLKHYFCVAHKESQMNLNGMKMTKL